MRIQQNILVTVDCLLISEDEIGHSVLLIQRKNDPYQGMWALPGGFIEVDEDLAVSAARELKEETGVNIRATSLRQLGTYGIPGRDPRGRTITVVFGCIIDRQLHEVQAADDALSAQWWNMETLPEMAFDHKKILDECLPGLL